MIQALSDFGENLGIAFQLRDDALDYTGRKSLLGKSTGNDLKEKNGSEFHYIFPPPCTLR